MKIVLVSYYCRYDEFPTYYTLGTLRLALAISDMEQCDIQILPVNSDRFDVDDINLDSIKNADLVGLPMYEWTKEHSKILAKYVKDGFVALGGPSIYDLSVKEWPEKTFVIRGEGENTLRTICQEFIKNPVQDVKNICNLSEKIFPVKEKIIFTKEVCEIYSGETLYSKESMSKLNLSEINNDFCWFETVRGCKFNCSFCGHNVRENVGGFDIEKVEAEIKNIGRLNFKETFIIDPELGGNRERGKKVLRLFTEYAPKCRIIMYLRAEFLDDEYIEIISKSNIKEVRIGIQTLNEKVASHIRNNSLRHMFDYLPSLSVKGITWMSELIVGLPGDDVYGLRETFRKLIGTIRPSIIQAYHLSLIPGTQLYDYVIVDSQGDRKIGWITKDMNGRAYESYSYTHKELNYMLVYSKCMTTIYNKTNWNFDKCEERVIPALSRINFLDDKCLSLEVDDIL